MTAFVLIGHVDHGKSTLAGRILCDTGFVEQRELEKLQKEAEANKMGSWWLSYLLDTDEHERLRGKTHQFNKIEFKHGETEFCLIDVPGHKQMVRQMIAGASEADIAVIVVSARKDEYIQGLSGQTIEHLMIARGMGLSNLVVAVNKMDCVDWDMEKFQEIQKVLNKHLKKIRFKTISYCPVSALEGDNVVHAKVDVECGHKSLLEVISDTPRTQDRIVPVAFGKSSIVVKAIFNNIENIVTIGCPLIVHHGQDIIEGVLTVIKGKHFIKNSNEVETIAVKFEQPLENIVPNVIFRSGDKTIGFGKVVNI